MKPTKEEFKKLQKLWYKRLEESGFKDIEKLEDKPVYDPPYLTKEYYELIYQAVQDEKTVFRNNIHKYILTRHSEGAQIKAIVRELLGQGTPRDRKSIRIIIRKYEMAWNIRHYTLKQLNVKMRKK